MSDGASPMKYVVIGVAVLGIGLVAWRNFGPSEEQAKAAEIIQPQKLSAAASLGKKSFDESCAQCHGVKLDGTDQGPPLVHDFYNPGHHGDGAFYSAIKNGVRQHHWGFGNMPAQPEVTEQKARMVIAYVREVQVANGITYKPH